MENERKELQDLIDFELEGTDVNYSEKMYLIESLEKNGYRKEKYVAKEIIDELLKNTRPTFNCIGLPIISLDANFALNLCKKYNINYKKEK